jgi:hypothetical protein
VGEEVVGEGTLQTDAEDIFLLDSFRTTEAKAWASLNKLYFWKQITPSH